MSRRSITRTVLLALLATTACTAGSPGAPTDRPSDGSPGPADRRPGPDTTGVPAGTALRSSGDLDITRDGTVVDGLDIAGCVVVRADDVVIQNSRIRCSDPPTGYVVQTTDGARDLLVQDTEIDGLGLSDIGIGSDNYTLRRVDVHGTNDGARLGDDVTVDASWIHDLQRQGGQHPDCLQATQGEGITITGNTLDAANTSTGDLGNAAIMLGSETGPRRLVDVQAEGNHLDGGNYTVNVRGDATIDDIVFRGNEYGPHHRYGPARAPAAVVFDGETTVGPGAATFRVEPAD